jgi:hypothetical protein
MISLSGPSKSGKTVLVERVVGADLLITVTGGSIWNQGDLWERVLAWMDAPDSVSTGKDASHKGSITGSATAGVSLLGFGKGEASGAGTIESGTTSSTVSTRRRGGMNQVVKDIGEASSFCSSMTSTTSNEVVGAKSPTSSRRRLALA